MTVHQQLRMERRVLLGDATEHRVVRKRVGLCGQGLQAVKHCLLLRELLHLRLSKFTLQVVLPGPEHEHRDLRIRNRGRVVYGIRNRLDHGGV